MSGERAPRLRRALLQGLGRLGTHSQTPLSPTARIVLIRPDHLGDVLLIGPAILALRQALPDTQLSLLVGPWSLEVARRGAAVDHLRALPFPGFTRAARPPFWSPYELLLSEARRLRQERYDLAVVLRPDHWWGALLALAAGVPRRLGFDTPATRPLLTHRLTLDVGHHSVELALDLARAASELCPSTAGVPGTAAPVPFRVSPEDRRSASALLDAHGLGTTPFVALHPGSGSPLKGWPAARWAALADAASVRLGSIAITGDEAELKSAQSVWAQMEQPAALLAGRTSLGTLAALMARARLVIGADSGPLHLAAALGVATLRLYGPTDVRRFGPWSERAPQRVVRAELPCSPCGNLSDPPCGALREPPCMQAITLRQAVADLTLLAATG